jgi:hypothetical protein
MEVTVKLTVDQLNAILTALNELPIKTGFGPVIRDIIEQVRPQIPESAPTETTDAANDQTAESAGQIVN